jgi:hypothetical protein
MRRIAFAFVAVSLLGYSSMAKEPKQYLSSFLASHASAERYEALVHIKNHTEQFTGLVEQSISAYGGDPDKIDGCLYLALLTEDRKIVPMLVQLYKRQAADEAACIYCCSLKLVLQDYYLKGLWDPTSAGLTKDQANILMLQGIDPERAPERLVIEGNISDPDLARMLRSIRKDSTKQLIRMAANESLPTMQRVYAADELNCRSPHSASTIDLIWLCTFPSTDAAGEYLCSLHGAILRNCANERKKN